MARLKRNSAILEQAERRLESVQSIDQNLDLGNGRTAAKFADLIKGLSDKLAAYNTALSGIDKMADDIKVAEKEVKAMAEQMLMGVGSCYGRDSQEYEMAGGTRRKNRSSKKSTAIAPDAPVRSVGNSSNGTSPNGTRASSTPA